MFASLFIISFTIQPFSFALVLYPDSRARITRPGGISLLLFVSCLYAPCNNIVITMKKKKTVRHYTHQPVRPSARRPYDAIKPDKGRVRALCILNFTSHAHIYRTGEMLRLIILEFFHVSGT